MLLWNLGCHNTGVIVAAIISLRKKIASSDMLESASGGGDQRPCVGSIYIYM